MTRSTGEPQPTDASFESITHRLSGIDLAELDRLAPFRQRRDRKYLVAESIAGAIIIEFAERLVALDIGARRSFRYETTYFDTPGLDLFEAAARGRRRRFKVRNRSYVDAGVSFCEVKSTEGFGRTEKYRRERPAGDLTELTAADRAFVDGVLGERSILPTLESTMTTRYLRTTVVDQGGAFRLTIDRQLRCDDRNGSSVELGPLAIAEVKSTAPRTELDRWLWRHDARPVRFSKYATAIATTRPGLAHHRWHRQMQLLVRT